MPKNKFWFEDDDIKLEVINDILWATYKPGIVIDRNVSSKMISMRIKMSNGKSHPVLLDCRGVKYWTMSSRNNDMKDQAYELISNMAVLLENKFSTGIWNLTVKVLPPPVSTKVFYDAQDAKNWLHGLKNTQP